MSADNYRNCPKCGTHGAREDYEIYSEEDSIYIYYSISCYACGYKDKIEEDREFKGIQGARK